MYEAFNVITASQLDISLLKEVGVFTQLKRYFSPTDGQDILIDLAARRRCDVDVRWIRSLNA